MATAAATGAGIALPLFGATTAQAADPGTWDRVAFCETGGLWQANTGNGFYGGLGITQDTWDQYGGGTYAERPDLASEAQQIAVAEKILTALGPNAWPGCEQGTGLLADTAQTAPVVVPTVQPGEHATPTTPVSSAPATGPSAPTADPTSPAVPTTPATPATPTTPAGPGTPGTPGTPSAGGTGGASSDPSVPPVVTTPGLPGLPGLPGTPVTSAPVTPPVTPGTGTATLAPTDPSAPGSVTPGVIDGAGRHAKPYSPSDEELAAQDQATRVQLFSLVGGGSPATTPADTVNKSDDSGTSRAEHYTVGDGDSLSGIASDQNVNGGWRHLYDVNHQSIGNNPNLIKPGQILNLG